MIQLLSESDKLELNFLFGMWEIRIFDLQSFNFDKQNNLKTRFDTTKFPERHIVMP